MPCWSSRSLCRPHLAAKAYTLYEKFRPEIPPGQRGEGASGKLDLDLIRKMASAWRGGAFTQIGIGRSFFDTVEKCGEKYSFLQSSVERFYRKV
jgi:hypothetical protein